MNIFFFYRVVATHGLMRIGTSSNHPRNHLDGLSFKLDILSGPRIIFEALPACLGFGQPWKVRAFY